MFCLMRLSVRFQDTETPRHGANGTREHPLSRHSFGWILLHAQQRTLSPDNAPKPRNKRWHALLP